MRYKYILLFLTFSFLSLLGVEKKTKSSCLILNNQSNFSDAHMAKLPEYWYVQVENLPTDKGVLTLSHSIALWEQTLTGQDGTISEEFRKIDSFSSDSKQSDITSDSLGISAQQVEHAIKPMYFMPGEKMILEIANHDKTWTDKLIFYPHPLHVSKGDKSIKAELLDFNPLVYRVNFHGFEGQDPCLLTTQAAGKKSVISEFVPSQNEFQFQLAFLSENKLGCQAIQFTVQTKEKDILKLKLPTSTQLIAFCKQSHTEYKKGIG